MTVENDCDVPFLVLYYLPFDVAWACSLPIWELATTWDGPHHDLNSLPPRPPACPGRALPGSTTTTATKSKGLRV